MKMDEQYLLSDGDMITLDDILLARENRSKRQRDFLTKYQLPLVSLTLVLPGNIKNSRGAHYLFNEALEAFKDNVDRKGWLIRELDIFESIAGPEAIIILHDDTLALKKIGIELEQEHFLGRLWDFDVITSDECAPISRKSLNEPVRRCLICHNDAKVCARSRAHSVDELRSVIQDKINCHQRVKQTFSFDSLTQQER